MLLNHDLKHVLMIIFLVIIVLTNNGSKRNVQKEIHKKICETLLKNVFYLGTTKHGSNSKMIYF